MNEHKKNHTTPRREAFRCTGQQLDAILRFAEKRKLDHQPLHLVVAEFWRSREHAKAT